MDRAPETKTYGPSYKADPDVVYFDVYGRPHRALVTAVHSMLEDGQTPWCVNLVWVTDDETKKDPYGLQLERATSVPHRVKSGAHGYNFVTRAEYDAEREAEAVAKIAEELGIQTD